MLFISRIKIFWFFFFISSLIPSLLFAKEKYPPTLYYNGNIFTARSDKPDANWFVVQKGRFVALGSGDKIPEEWKELENKIDLKGAFVSPGFIDAHVHFVDGGLGLLQSNLGNLDSTSEVITALEKEKQQVLGDWVIARNLSPDIFDNRLPTHEDFRGLPPDFKTTPLFILFNDGHHAYVNEAGLTKLKIDEKTPDPERGKMIRDAQNRPTGVLVDEATWEALKKIYEDIPTETLSQAILTAQQKALSYGITTLGDNTFFPDHMALYLKLQKKNVFFMRVMSRSFGKVYMTKLMMQGLGGSYTGRKSVSLQYFGEKFFLDGSLSMSAQDRSPEKEPPGGIPFYTEAELKKIFLFEGRTGLAFHTQSEESLKRLIDAKHSILNRRKSKMPDVIDHCGSCSAEWISKIEENKFKVTLLPLQLYDLKGLTQSYGEVQVSKLLDFRGLFESKIDPAFTSDWPYGLGTPPRGQEIDLTQLSLSPLAGVASVVSGRFPDGEMIPYASTRTLSLDQALLGITRYGAAAVGRSKDLGKISMGYLADFLIFSESPFQVDPVHLYQMTPEATYVAGKKVYESSSSTPSPGGRGQGGGGTLEKTSPEELAKKFTSPPRGWAPAPVIGYDPTYGILLGGAVFTYPYKEKGWFGDVQIIAAPQQGTVRSYVDLDYLKLKPWFTPQLRLYFNSIQDQYFGVGNDTPSQSYFLDEPQQVEVKAGALFHLKHKLHLGAYGIYDYLTDGKAGAIEQIAGPFEGFIDGNAAALDFEFIHDTRDNPFSTRYGSKKTLWFKPWFIQGSTGTPRYQLGAEYDQFIALYAPDLILAMRFEGAASVGHPSYLNNYTLGGRKRLRGYRDNRFRGDYYALGTAEIRFPLWYIFSGVAFAEVGKVWVDGLNNSIRNIGYTGGVGLRFGIPPDFRIKLRLDAGFAPDQHGIFFGYGEAF